jgi:hypothetical protein
MYKTLALEVLHKLIEISNKITYGMYIIIFIIINIIIIIIINTCSVTTKYMATNNHSKRYEYVHLGSKVSHYSGDNRFEYSPGFRQPGRNFVLNPIRHMWR